MNIEEVSQSGSFESIFVEDTETNHVSAYITPYKVPSTKTYSALKIEMPTTKTNTLVLKKIDPLTKQLHTLIADSTALSLQLSPTETLDFSLSTNTNIDKLSYSLHLLVDQHCVEFKLDRTLLTSLFSDHVAGIPFDIIPQELKLSILQATIAPLVKVISNLIGSTIELVAVKSPSLEKDDKPTITRGQLTIKGHNNGYPYQAFLLVTQAILPQLATLLDQCDITIPPKFPVNTLPLWLSASITGLKLSRSDIASLEKNDLIILSSPFSSYLETISLSVGGQHLFNARYKTGELIIYHQLKDQTMNNNLTANENEQQPTTLGNIKVEVVFELARQVTTLDELNQLTPGQLFDLEKPLQSSVIVRANGIAVATAELVEINENVGARITALIVKEN
jgi:type III secretion protein Q